MAELDEELLEDLYAWVDKIPLSRPKKNIQRDFSDGVLVAEVIRHYFPSYVDIHNYPQSFNSKQKMTNWCLLSRKVFKRMGFEITDDVMHNIVHCKQWAIEQFLMMLRRKIDRHLFENQRTKGDKEPLSDRPEADQNLHTKRSSPIPGSNKAGRDDGVKYNSNVGQMPLAAGAKTSPSPAFHLGTGRTAGGSQPNQYKGELVPKLAVEEKEQEILAKEETIQILHAKVRRLEHLLHLKDIRIDDLQGRLDRMEIELRPTAQRK